MDWYSQLFELIEMRSFSNLWFWIALAVAWSSVSHWVMGVPFDMVARSRREGGQAELDLMAAVQVSVNRMLMIARVSGLWAIGVLCFVITGLVLLGWVYNVELAQAIFLLAFPMSLVQMLNLRTAAKIEQAAPTPDEVRRILAGLRLKTQLIGAVSIFVTAMWGMYQNLAIGVLGG